MKIPRILFGSVAARTTTLVLTLVAVIMLVAGFWQMHYVRTGAAAEAQRQAARSMDGAIAIIDNHISNIETAVQTSASYAQMFAPHETLCYKLLERLIDANKDIAAVTLLYRADFFPTHGRYYAPTVTRDPRTGTLDIDEIGGPANDFCYLETDSNWIYTNQLNRGYWCLPYLDSMSTKRPMVTYSVPLHDDAGTTYAVLCADIDLRWVKRLVEQAKPFDFSTVAVLSRDGQFVCHPDSSLLLNPVVMKQVRQQGSRQLVELMDRMLAMKKGCDTMYASWLAGNGDKRADMGDMIVYYAPVEHPLWSLSFTLPEKMIMQGPDRLRANMLILLGIMLLAVSLVLYFVIRAQLWPLKLLASETHKVASGDFHTQLPVFKSHDEISNLRDSFADMQESLSAYIGQLQQTTASKASIESELKVASTIQMSMLPKTFPPFPDRDDIDLFGQLLPAKAVGGDLFDFFIRDEKLFFCIGDVSGKGVPAALVMAVTRSLFRSVSAHEARPERIIGTINNTMAEGNETNMFVTLFVGVLDLPTGRLRYSNAGHDAPFIIESGVSGELRTESVEFAPAAPSTLESNAVANSTLYTLHSTLSSPNSQLSALPVDANLPAGVMEGWKFTAQETLIAPGTTIFLYTDGLTEAENISHDQFGEERIMKVLETHPRLLIDKMTAAVHQFVGEAEQSDDLTMLAIRYTKQQQTERLQRCLTLRNDVQDVPQLAMFVDEVCEAVGLDMSTTMSLNLALEEAVVNVMNYAYPKGTEGTVNIEACANDERLRFVISDSGTPFDPTARGEVDTTLSAEERPIGGLGIHLVRQIMDSINYMRTDGQNILTLTKALR